MEQLHEFLLKHGENIVDMMGDEIDRIEMNLSVIEFDFLFFFLSLHPILTPFLIHPFHQTSPKQILATVH